MSMDDAFEIFLMTTPGQERWLAYEAREIGFTKPMTRPGGVMVRGGWSHVWRANLALRGAGRVVAHFAAFHAVHLSQLDKRARKVPWANVLRKDVAFRVEATCATSRIYHSGAAAERIERAIREELGAPFSPDAAVCVRVRIEDDLCTIGIDTSGEPLHKRGFKEAVAKAPMRETMAALFLRQCGYDGHEPVLDPMCGSGTFVIEAAEIAAGLKPGRARSFAFEQLATFDPVAWKAMRDSPPPPRGEGLGVGGAPAADGLRSPPPQPSPTRGEFATLGFYGSDWDAGAVAMSRANAERAGVAATTEFQQLSVNDLVAPAGPPGLVIVNPPYGARIGDKQGLHALYQALGQSLKSRFHGWRVGLITSEAALAKATGLPFKPPGPPVSHGGLRVTLYTTEPLP